VNRPGFGGAAGRNVVDHVPPSIHINLGSCSRSGPATSRTLEFWQYGQRVGRGSPFE
jgi:hypothetical protein